MRLLAVHWPAVLAVAGELERVGTLTGRQVEEVMRRAAGRTCTPGTWTRANSRWWA